jgi:hypothetical protein
MELSYHAGIFADFYDSVDVTANSEGKWKYNYDLIGGIDAYLYWTSAQGDTVEIYGTTAQVYVTVGKSILSGSINPGLTATVGLRDGSDVLIGVASGIGDEYGYFSTAFRNGSAHAVALQSGDRVVGRTMASDLDWIVPEIEASADVASNMVTGACQDAGALSDLAIVSLRRTGHTRGLAFVTPEPDGSFEFDFDDPPGGFADPANVKHGDRLIVECMLDTGDWVIQSFDVP